MNWLQQIDYDLFIAINGWHSPLGDEFFYLISTRWAWIPAYFLFATLLVKKHNFKTGMTYVLVIGITVTVADIVSTQIFKELFHRLRPCHDPVLAADVHLYANDCGGLYGFVSSHAANFGAWCTLCFLWLNRKVKAVFWILLPCLLLVSYSRIYLGRHFPGDVLFGALIGISLALFAYYVVSKWIKPETA